MTTDSARPGIRTLSIRRIRGRLCVDTRDDVAVEAPLRIELDHPELDAPQTVVITLRTPGHDVELALGYLHGEDLLRGGTQVVGTRALGTDDLRVELAGEPPDLSRLARGGPQHSGCGACGKLSMSALIGDPRAVAGSQQIDQQRLLLLPTALRAAQSNFMRTGGLHAIGLFDLRGQLLALREDVGRHNAMDKLVGAAHLSGTLPWTDQLLLLSGRASFELLQKAARAGASIVAAIGAPSSLAVELAERAGITLIGFLRDDGFNVYTHAQRVQLDA